MLIQGVAVKNSGVKFAFGDLEKYQVSVNVPNGFYFNVIDGVFSLKF